MTYDLFVFGNPLLDLQVKDVDKKVLEKYDLKADDAILVEEKHESIYDYVRENFEIAYVAGGAAQNTARAAQVCLITRTHCQANVLTAILFWLCCVVLLAA